jgi:HlyD family secretion protein
MAIPGEVAEIFVESGDTVRAGDPLLRLDVEAAGRSLATAELTLAIQEANLATLQAPAGESDLLAAEAAVAGAQAQLDDLLAGPGEAEIVASEAGQRASEANLRAAEGQLDLALNGASEADIAAAQANLTAALGEQQSLQDLYDRLVECYEFSTPDGEIVEFCPGLGVPEEQTRNNLEVARANAAVAQARLDALLAGPEASSIAIAQAGLDSAAAKLEAAQANHELLLKGATESQVAAARANLAQAQMNLDSLKKGPSETRLTMAQIAVEQARINLARAQGSLDEATLKAPFDGLVTAINATVGQTAGGVLVEMVTGSLEIVIDVDEVDIGSLEVGQPAAISLEAWPEAEIQGQVVSISPQAKSNSSGLVVYEVHLSLSETELLLLVGMTANANLLTAEHQDVLLVPNAAVHVDREAGTFSVNRLVGVTVGLRDNRYTQITGGLNEGDRLFLGDALPDQSFGPGSDGNQRPGGGFFGN